MESFPVTGHSHPSPCFGYAWPSDTVPAQTYAYQQPPQPQQQNFIVCTSEDDIRSSSRTSSNHGNVLAIQEARVTEESVSDSKVSTVEKITVKLQPRAPEWTEAEVVSLIGAVRKYGTNWKVIMEDESFSSKFHPCRTRMSLKTKWFKMKNIQGFDFAVSNVEEFAQRICGSNGSKNSQNPSKISPKTRKVSFNKLESSQLAERPESTLLTKSGNSPKSSNHHSPKILAVQIVKGEELMPWGDVKPSSSASESQDSLQTPDSTTSEDEPAKQSSKKRRRTAVSFQYVEKIISHRFENDELEFMLKWKNGESEDSWHHLKDISGPIGQLLAFYFNDAEGISLQEICKISISTQKTKRKV